MKSLLKVLPLVLAVGFSSFSMAQKKDDYKWIGDYEVKSIGPVQSGMREITVLGTKAKEKDAVETAKRNAVEACLFGGLSAQGSTAETPAIISTTPDEVVADNQEFFNTFFELKDKKHAGGVYMRYINRSTEVSLEKVKGGYVATVTVQVLYDKLRGYMEEKGFAKKLNDVAVSIARPTLMVVPADSYLKKRGFGKDVEIDGRMRFDADYQKAFTEDSDLRLVIAELSKIMAQRGFPLKSLEQTLKTMQQDQVIQMAAEGNAVKQETALDIVSRTAMPDFIIDLDFSIMQRGPQRYIQFILIGRDAYTNEDPVNESGGGQPSSSASVSVLLEEAVLNYMDSFCSQLMSYFTDMQQRGRKITVTMALAENADIDFNSEVSFEGETGSLNDFITMWMTENTVNGMFTRTTSSPNQLNFEQVRIPLVKTKKSFGKEITIALTAESFIDGFVKDISGMGINSVKIERGLGRVDLIIGGTE